MLEDFVSDAGVFQKPAATPQVAEAGFERRLRRALGDDHELLEEIGSGGFGRVYRARDLGLEREVAIKVLSDGFEQDPDRLARFRPNEDGPATVPVDGNRVLREFLG